MEIRQRNSAPMQATALSGRPKVLIGRKKVHSGDPTGAVACMRALLVCPISNKEGFCGVWGQKNAQKALVFIKPEAIMAELDTIWVKMLLSLKHGELFSEMALWLTPNAGSGAPPPPPPPPPATHPGGTNTTQRTDRVRGGNNGFRVATRVQGSHTPQGPSPAPI